ncbi:MAG: hypothetical protein U9Q76_02065 [candidate division WOR-3 bacterium]|nr:hypothetical protein [candidate division WOR-3 bacterium]
MADNEAKVIEAFKKAGEPLKAGQVVEATDIDAACKIIRRAEVVSLSRKEI